MPTYDYRCNGCRHELEIFQSISESPKRKCPKCGKSKLERQIGAGAGVLFRGGGFYQTDYRSDSYKKGEGAEKAASTPSSSTPDAKSANDAKSAPDAKRTNDAKSAPDAKRTNESKSSASTPGDGKAGSDKPSSKADTPKKKKPDARG